MRWLFLVDNIRDQTTKRAIDRAPSFMAFSCAMLNKSINWEKCRGRHVQSELLKEIINNLPWLDVTRMSEM